MWKEKNSKKDGGKHSLKQKTKNVFKIIWRVLRWIVAVVAIIMMFAHIVLWISLLLLILLTISWVHKQIEKIIPKFKNIFIKIPVFVILTILFISLLSIDQDTITWDLVKVWEITVQQWDWDPDFLRDYSYHIVKLAETYRDAYLLENFSFEIKRWDMTNTEYLELLDLIYTKWDEVETLADGLDYFIENSSDELSYIRLPDEYIFSQAFAFGLSTEEMMWQEIMRQYEEDDLSVLSNERMISEKKTAKIIKDRKKVESDKRDKCDAIKQANPKKSWLEIVQSEFKFDSSKAKMRARDRHNEVLKSVEDQIQRENTKEKYYMLFQNWIKIWVYVTGAPAAVAAWGGALVASSLFIWGVDVWIAVWKSIDLIFNWKKPTKVTEDRGTMDTVVWTLSLFTNVSSLYQNKWARDPANHVFIADTAWKFVRGTYDYIMNLKPDNTSIDVYVSNDWSKLNYGNQNGWYWNEYLPNYLLNSNNKELSSDESLKITLAALEAEKQRLKDAGTFKTIKTKNENDNYQESLDNVYTQTDNGIQMIKDTDERKETQEAVDSYQWEEIDWDELFKKSEAIFD